MKARRSGGRAGPRDFLRSGEPRLRAAPGGANLLRSGEPRLANRGSGRRACV